MHMAGHLRLGCAAGRACTEAAPAGADADRAHAGASNTWLLSSACAAAAITHHCVSSAALTCWGLAHAGALAGWGLPNSSSSRPKPSRPRAAELLAPAGLPLSSGPLPAAWPISSRCSISCHNERSPCTQQPESSIQMRHLMPLWSRPLARTQSTPASQLRSSCSTGSSPLDQKQCGTTSGCCSISCHPEQDACTAAMLLSLYAMSAAGEPTLTLRQITSAVSARTRHVLG